jgi:hypothetical protein
LKSLKISPQIILTQQIYASYTLKNIPNILIVKNKLKRIRQKKYLECERMHKKTRSRGNKAKNSHKNTHKMPKRRILVG